MSIIIIIVLIVSMCSQHKSISLPQRGNEVIMLMTNAEYYTEHLWTKGSTQNSCTLYNIQIQNIQINDGKSSKLIAQNDRTRGELSNKILIVIARIGIKLIYLSSVAELISRMRKCTIAWSASTIAWNSGGCIHDLHSCTCKFSI